MPCRDGLPRLAALLERVADCDADEGVLEGLRALAEMVRDTSDCAIGYEAARACSRVSMRSPTSTPAT